jgi:hypothetical protein
MAKAVPIPVSLAMQLPWCVFRTARLQLTGTSAPIIHQGRGQDHQKQFPNYKTRCFSHVFLFDKHCPDGFSPTTTASSNGSS